MNLIIALLTLVLVLNSLFLILLVLIQLPKKDAGIGLAFGAAATDALFGAGSGTVLTKMTKYGTGVFLVVSLVLSILMNHRARAAGRGIASELEKKGGPVAVMPATAAPTNQPVTLLQTGTNLVAPAANAANPAPAAENPAK
jgi:preprotein translocase subunit SecG